MTSTWNRIYGGLASLKLTIVVLATLAIALIAGTFYESANGTPMVQRTFYASRWFDAILIVLAINFVSCTSKRYPYKPHQVGWLMVHCGILTIMTGAFLTRNFGREGELFLNEGESRDFMTSARPFLNVRVARDGVDGLLVPVVFPIKEQGAVVNADLAVRKSPIRLHVKRYFPNARPKERVEDGTTPNPAVRIQVVRDEARQEAWLLPRVAGRASIEQPVRIEATEAASAAAAESILAALASERGRGRGALQLRVGANPFEPIPLEGDIPRSVERGRHTVRLREWYSNFVFQGDKPVNASAAMLNPAIIFDVDGPSGAETHIAFAFHDFRSLLVPESDRGYDVHAEYAYEGMGTGTPRLVLVRTPDGDWRAGATFELEGATTAALPPGSALRAPAARLEVTLLEVLDRAALANEMTNVDRQELNPSLEMQVVHGTERSELFWLTYGDTRTVQVGDREVVLELGRKQLPLGFAVQLVDFRETTYPGTTRSAGFESDVIVSDQRGVPVPINISMNQPLKYRGFRLFQSSFVRQDGTEASIFSVSYDPGVTVVYTGFVIFIVGLVAVFYLKPLIRRAYELPPPRRTAPLAAPIPERT